MADYGYTGKIKLEIDDDTLKNQLGGLEKIFGKSFKKKFSIDINLDSPKFKGNIDNFVKEFEIKLNSITFRPKVDLVISDIEKSLSKSLNVKPKKYEKLKRNRLEEETRKIVGPGNVMHRTAADEINNNFGKAVASVSPIIKDPIIKKEQVLTPEVVVHPDKKQFEKMKSAGPAPEYTPAPEKQSDRQQENIRNYQEDMVQLLSQMLSKSDELVRLKKMQFVLNNKDLKLEIQQKKLDQQEIKDQKQLNKLDVQEVKTQQSTETSVEATKDSMSDLTYTLKELVTHIKESNELYKQTGLEAEKIRKTEESKTELQKESNEERKKELGFLGKTRDVIKNGILTATEKTSSAFGYIKNTFMGISDAGTGFLEAIMGTNKGIKEIVGGIGLYLTGVSFIESSLKKQRAIIAENALQFDGVVNSADLTAEAINKQNQELGSAHTRAKRLHALFGLSDEEIMSTRKQLAMMGIDIRKFADGADKGEHYVSKLQERMAALAVTTGKTYAEVQDMAIALAQRQNISDLNEAVDLIYKQRAAIKEAGISAQNYNDIINTVGTSFGDLGGSMDGIINLTTMFAGKLKKELGLADDQVKDLTKSLMEGISGKGMTKGQKLLEIEAIMKMPGFDKSLKELSDAIKVPMETATTEQKAIKKAFAGYPELIEKLASGKGLDPASLTNFSDRLRQTSIGMEAALKVRSDYLDELKSAGYTTFQIDELLKSRYALDEKQIQSIRIMNEELNKSGKSLHDWYVENNKTLEADAKKMSDIAVNSAKETANLQRTTMERVMATMEEKVYKWMNDGLNSRDITEMFKSIEGFVPEGMREKFNDLAGSLGNLTHESKAYMKNAIEQLPEEISGMNTGFAKKLLNSILENVGSGPGALKLAGGALAAKGGYDILKDMKDSMFGSKNGAGSSGSSGKNKGFLGGLFGGGSKEQENGGAPEGGAGAYAFDPDLVQDELERGYKSGKITGVITGGLMAYMAKSMSGVGQELKRLAASKEVLLEKLKIAPADKELQKELENINQKELTINSKLEEFANKQSALEDERNNIIKELEFSEGDEKERLGFAKKAIEEQLENLKDQKEDLAKGLAYYTKKTGLMIGGLTAGISGWYVDKKRTAAKRERMSTLRGRAGESDQEEFRKSIGYDTTDVSVNIQKEQLLLLDDIYQVLRNGGSGGAGTASSIATSAQHAVVITAVNKTIGKIMPGLTSISDNIKKFAIAKMTPIMAPIATMASAVSSILGVAAVGYATYKLSDLLLNKYGGLDKKIADITVGTDKELYEKKHRETVASKMSFFGKQEGYTVEDVEARQKKVEKSSEIDRSQMSDEQLKNLAKNAKKMMKDFDSTAEIMKKDLDANKPADLYSKYGGDSRDDVEKKMTATWKTAKAYKAQAEKAESILKQREGSFVEATKKITGEYDSFVKKFEDEFKSDMDKLSKGESVSRDGKQVTKQELLKLHKEKLETVYKGIVKGKVDASDVYDKDKLKTKIEKYSKDKMNESLKNLSGEKQEKQSETTKEMKSTSTETLDYWKKKAESVLKDVGAAMPDLSKMDLGQLKNIASGILPTSMMGANMMDISKIIPADVTKKVMEFASKIYDSSKLFLSTSELLSKAGPYLITFANFFKDFDLKGYFTGALDWLKNIDFKGMWDDFKTGLKLFWEAVKMFAASVKTKVSDLYDKYKIDVPSLSEIGKETGNIAYDKFEEYKSKGSDLSDKLDMKNPLSDFKIELPKVKDYEISPEARNITNKMASMAGVIKDKAAAGTASVTSIAKQTGSSLAAGVIKGIDSLGNLKVDLTIKDFKSQVNNLVKEVTTEIDRQKTKV